MIEVKCNPLYRITLDQESAAAIIDLIGNTSTAQRKGCGLTKEQDELCLELYHKLGFYVRNIKQTEKDNDL